MVVEVFEALHSTQARMVYSRLYEAAGIMAFSNAKSKSHREYSNHLIKHHFSLTYAASCGKGAVLAGLHVDQTFLYPIIASSNTH